MLHGVMEILRVLSAPSLAQLRPRLPFLVRCSEPFFVNPQPLIKGPTSRYVRAKKQRQPLLKSHICLVLLLAKRAEAGPSRNHSAEKLIPRCSSFRLSSRQPLSRPVCYIPLDLKRTGWTRLQIWNTCSRHNCPGWQRTTILVFRVGLHTTTALRTRPSAES